MSLFRTVGTKVKGLLGDEQFFDRLARAQAFANGDHMGVAEIGAMLRRAARDRRSELAPATAEPPTNTSEDASHVATNTGPGGGTWGQDVSLPLPPDFAAKDWILDALPGLFGGQNLQWGRRPPGQSDVNGLSMPHAFHPFRR